VGNVAFLAGRERDKKREEVTARGRVLSIKIADQAKRHFWGKKNLCRDRKEF